ncbi:MAG: hypothetical protein AAF467_04040 [Actinomycetota bacterium]
MPRGSDYPGPVEALERYTAMVDAAGHGEVKGAKNPYTSRNGHMMSFLTPDGVIALHFSPELEEEFRSTFASGPVEQYGATMRGYSSVPSDLMEATDQLVEWYDRAWEWIGTLPPKPTKKPAKKTATKKKQPAKKKASGS